MYKYGNRHSKVMNNYLKNNMEGAKEIAHSKNGS
jgi:hypothetical protein